MPTKVCLYCGKAFYTKSHTDYCNDCRIVHRRRRNNEYNAAHQEERRECAKRYRENNRERLKKINKEYYRKNRARLIADAVRRKKKIEPLPFTIIDVDGQRIKMYQCDRLGLKAKHLPCGDRWQCWDKQPCQYMPKGKTPMEYGDDRGQLSWFEKSKIKPVFEDD